jgi:hypothetical protein
LFGDDEHPVYVRNALDKRYSSISTRISFISDCHHWNSNNMELTEVGNIKIGFFGLLNFI